MSTPSVQDSVLQAAVVPKGEYAYLVHPLLDGVPRVDPALLEAAASWMASHPAVADATLILAPEAMALPLAAMVSAQTRIPYVIARKRAYDLPGERVVRAKTGYSAPTLWVNDVKAADRVLVLDDVLSTGGTLDALLAAVPEVTGVLVLVDKGDARKRLEHDHGVPIAAMVTVDVGHEGVRLRADA